MVDHDASIDADLQSGGQGMPETKVARLLSHLAEAIDAHPAPAALRECIAVLSEELAGERITTRAQLRDNEKFASIGRLAAGIAHEINTPIQYIGDNLRSLSDIIQDLTTMVGKYCELTRLAKWGRLTPEVLADIEAAESDLDIEYLLEDAPKAITDGLDGVERVSEIARAMKDFSHVERTDASEIDVNRLLQSTLTVARNEYKYIASIETHYGDVPAVEGCAGELRQVFLNLLVNGAHAVAETRTFGTIRISTRRDGEHIEIVIADTGTGVPEDIRDKVFEPFFTTKEIGKGTGQGLSIARHLVVDKHRGSLSFDTEMGKGTRFIVRLPIKTPDGTVHP